MIDFLRSNPFMTRDEYMWKWSVAQIRLAAMDYTRNVYLSEKAYKKYKNKISSRVRTHTDPEAFMKALKIPKL